MNFEISFLLLLAVVHSGKSLQCYNCDSRNDANCLDGSALKETHKTDCNSAAIRQFTESFNSVSQTVSQWGSQFGIQFDAPTMSPDMIACQKVEIMDDAKSKSYVLRSCAPAVKDSEDMCTYVQNRLANANTKVKCSQCKSDYCNSSKMVSPTVYTILITMAAVLFFSK